MRVESGTFPAHVRLDRGSRDRPLAVRHRTTDGDRPHGLTALPPESQIQGMASGSDRLCNYLRVWDRRVHSLPTARYQRRVRHAARGRDVLATPPTRFTR